MLRSIVMLVAGALLVGSIVEVGAQSAPYRRMTDLGFAQLASRIIIASNQTGARLAALLHNAPTIPNQSLPYTARGEIQQGLDAALSASSQEARQASQLAPPFPTDAVASRLVSILDERATAVSRLVTTIDGMLGMSPIVIAGAPIPNPPRSIGSAALIPLAQAAQRMTADGAQIQQADRRYAALLTSLRRGRPSVRSMRLPPSIWAPPGAPLRATRLGAGAALILSSVALIPYHQMVITAVGLTPPAIPSASPNDPAGSGMIGVSCNAPSSTNPGAAPTVLPPTTSITPEVTVTNCGTVTERAVTVRETLTLADLAGTPAPRGNAAGSSHRTVVTVVSGQSLALSLSALSVVRGHDYLLTIELVPPAGQANLAGTSQQFLLHIVV
ncbi:MAG: hypothetical protein ACYCV7_07245 [Acidimicrobiales bacterium]